MIFHVYRVVIDDKNADEIAVSLEDDLVKHYWATMDGFKTMKLTPPSIKLFTTLGLL